MSTNWFKKKGGRQASDCPPIFHLFLACDPCFTCFYLTSDQSWLSLTTAKEMTEQHRIYFLEADILKIHIIMSIV